MNRQNINLINPVFGTETAPAPSELRGTAFDLFNFASGIALLLASLIAGFLWKAIGPSATFLVGAVFTAIGMIGAVSFIARPQSSNS